MKALIVILAGLLCSAPVFAETSHEILLTCQGRANSAVMAGETVEFLRDGMKRLVRYRLGDEVKMIPVIGVSGSEHMGQDGDWLVFFEALQPPTHFLFTLLDSRDYQTSIGPVHLDCELPFREEDF